MPWKSQKKLQKERFNMAKMTFSASVEKVQLSQLILISPIVLTLLILFNIPVERIHKLDTNLDPKFQRNNWNSEIN